MLYRMRDSCLGFPLHLERPIEGLQFISPHLGSRPKPLPLVTALFLLKYNVVLLGVAVEDSITPFLGSYFRGGSSYSSGRLVKDILELIAHLWHQSKHSLSPTVQSRSLTALFLSTFVVGVAPLLWRARSLGIGSAFHLRDPLDEIYASYVASSNIFIHVYFLSFICCAATLAFLQIFHLYMYCNQSS